jgi:pimeloyl-ACP methyl ester carboxylesterase
VEDVDAMKIEEVPFSVDGLTLRLRHCVSELKVPRGRSGEGHAVLMLHGGNSSSDTYTLPNDGFAGYLADRLWDVWLLDYRCSPFVQDELAKQRPLGGSALAECSFFTLDRIVDFDIPEALAKLIPRIGDAELSVMGHCVGGGTVALAIARGKFKRVRNVVLSALGLFYEVPWNGWVKAEDYLIERVLAQDPTCRAIDPKNLRAWPAVMRTAEGSWPKAWLPSGTEPWESMLRLLTFMFGQPYFLDAIDPSLRCAKLLPVFGNMHLGTYWHLGQMVRRGFAAKFNEPDVIDRSRLLRRRPRASHREGPTGGDLASGPNFKDKVVTLVSGAENRLWHRDSMDLMYEWLCNNAGGGSGRFYKQAYRGYGLQEIVWGTNAPDDIFPHIESGLLGRPAEAVPRHTPGDPRRAVI